MRLLFLAFYMISSSSLSGLVAAQEFYAGKTINLVVGTEVGGGYDIYAAQSPDISGVISLENL